MGVECPEWDTQPGDTGTAPAGLCPHLGASRGSGELLQLLGRDMGHVWQEL